ncbi:hypothetical protein CEP54_000593 [Fusarium duplospermum]|uniref:Uncharacterized protein n=1 Tax=Fusarium duplospermum TaxID=1325734 RepID=A0A428R559_9HYPO|nr:hypothetical protein CEP54_000593 [Fusarium duplospermum]
MLSHFSTQWMLHTHWQTHPRSPTWRLTPTTASLTPHVRVGQAPKTGNRQSTAFNIVDSWPLVREKSIHGPLATATVRLLSSESRVATSSIVIRNGQALADPFWLSRLPFCALNSSELPGLVAWLVSFTSNSRLMMPSLVMMHWLSSCLFPVAI